MDGDVSAVSGLWGFASSENVGAQDYTYRVGHTHVYVRR